MMRRIRVSILVLLASMWLIGGLRAESNDYPLIAPDVAQRYGLERAWFTQIPLASGHEGIVDLRLQVSSVNMQTMFRISTDLGRVYSISERDLNAFGKPRGVDGAGKAAAEKVRVLRLEGIESTIERVVVPDITMYVATSAGRIVAIDAETGRTLWTVSVGTMRYPTTQLAVTESHLAVVNGQSLYVLDSTEGSILEQRRIIGAPAAGPTISGNTAYVPLLNGHLSAFTFGENAPWWPLSYRSRGSVHYSPVTAGNAVVWANDMGDISVLTAGKQGIRYRLRLTDAIAGPILYNPPAQILGVTATGYVYSFDVTNGQLLWRYASGEPSDEPAALVGDTVFLMTRQSGMHTIDATTGRRKWPVPYPLARQFVAATAEHVYCTTTTGALAVLDGDTGQLVGHIPMNLSNRVFANNQTDRIYIATHSGALQCLHEIGTDLPILHVGDVLKETPSTEPPTGEGQEPPKAEPIDPFSEGVTDPEPSPPNSNPFDTDAPADDTKEGGDESIDPFAEDE